MRDWAHAPVHRLDQAGAYMVTAGTYRKEFFLSSTERLGLVQDTLFELAEKLGWRLQAWAIMGNHYHFVGLSEQGAGTLREMISRLHMVTAKALNGLDGTPGRRVWYEDWDTHITFERSYLVRLNYVHTNPVHHGVVEAASLYPWCSAGWFERTADAAFRKTVASFKTDRVRVRDDF